MMLTNGIVKALSFCGFLAALTACSPAPQHVDSYTSSGGEVTLIENARESCTRACNADYDRCGDSRASREVGLNGQMQGVLGGGADCRDDLKACLASCKTR